MANTKPPEQDALPKIGRVTEVCKEWTVREDGALAYRLQNQEITDHYRGNKFRNAVVREDFPRALDEQIREQKLAEQAAAVYHQMLAEQEEIDNLYAQQLAERIQNEETTKRRTLEVHDEKVAHLLERQLSERSSSTSRFLYNYGANSPRRQALAMPLPCDNPITSSSQPSVAPHDHYLYSEPYNNVEAVTNQLDQIDIAEMSQRELQEQKDAMLARQLQQQEDANEITQLDRDRLLAIEAQDKELAKLLQERERQKVKRARERARQKALAKKQQQDANQIMPDDAYSQPADLLPSSQSASQRYSYSQPHVADDDVNYSFPVDVLVGKAHDQSLKSNCSPTKQHNVDLLNCSNYSPERSNSGEVRQPVRPSQLDLRPNHKSRSDASETPSSSQLMNIAMAIDPTYNRSGSYCDTTSSTGSSSSPGVVLPPPDISEHEEDLSPVPPYMPIQGQRRTASLEKKSKKKVKDGCKQQ